MKILLTLSWFGAVDAFTTPSGAALLFQHGRLFRGLLFQSLQPEGGNNNNDNPLGAGNSMDEETRMAAVRSLQNSFYASEQPTATTSTRLDASTGILLNLPLWRVGWVELPGRTNVLNVHEGQYTHMFEQILRGPEPWYFGHLFLDGGSKNLRNTPLLTHREALSSRSSSSPVLGTLMQVKDYRRSLDGRLILLVQVMERFVVDSVVQSLPYSVGHVQILPDIPHDNCDASRHMDENVAKIKRARVVRRSFALHKYEFEDTKLPLPQSEYMDTSEIFGTELMKVLPLSYYSRDASLLDDLDGTISEEAPTATTDNKDTPSFLGGVPSLEQQLFSRGILKEPATLSKTADSSERFMWLALEAYTRSLQFSLPEQALCLKPPEMDYLNLPDAKYPLSPNYPKERRQERLSYTVAGFLPRELRQRWLSIGSTDARLEAVLKQLQLILDALMGEFQ